MILDRESRGLPGGLKATWAIARTRRQQKKIDAAGIGDSRIVGGWIVRIRKPDRRILNATSVRQMSIEFVGNLDADEMMARPLRFTRSVVETGPRRDHVFVQHHQNYVTEIVFAVGEMIRHGFINRPRSTPGRESEQKPFAAALPRLVDALEKRRREVLANSGRRIETTHTGVVGLARAHIAAFIRESAIAS